MKSREQLPVNNNRLKSAASISLLTSLALTGCAVTEEPKEAPAVSATETATPIEVITVTPSTPTPTPTETTKPLPTDMPEIPIDEPVASETETASEVDLEAFWAMTPEEISALPREEAIQYVHAALPNRDQLAADYERVSYIDIPTSSEISIDNTPQQISNSTSFMNIAILALPPEKRANALAALYYEGANAKSYQTTVDRYSHFDVKMDYGNLLYANTNIPRIGAVVVSSEEVAYTDNEAKTPYKDITYKYSQENPPTETYTIRHYLVGDEWVYGEVHDNY